MNGILGTTELLLGTPLDAEPAPLRRDRAPLGDGAAGADRRRARPVAHRGRASSTLHTTSFDLRALVTEAVDLMAATARDKPVALSCTISPRLPERVEGDPMRLRQLLVNLLHNARQVHRARPRRPRGDGPRRARPTRCACASRCATPASASPRSSSTRCSTRSRRPTRRARGATAAAASAWRSSSELAELMGGRVGVDSRARRGLDLLVRAAR